MYKTQLFSETQLKILRLGTMGHVAIYVFFGLICKIVPMITTTKFTFATMNIWIKYESHTYIRNKALEQEGRHVKHEHRQLFPYSSPEMIKYRTHVKELCSEAAVVGIG